MKKKTQVEVIEEFRAVHGDLYDYSKVEYVDMHSVIEVICSVHGSFFPKPQNHKNGSGCRKCADEANSKNYRTSVEDFVSQARVVHGGAYDYSLVKQFKTQHDNIMIICPTHGEFEQKAYAHLAGKGCMECGRENTIIAITGGTKNIDRIKYAEMYMEQLNKKTDILYKPKSIFEEFINQKTPITFICPEHGEFMMSPFNVLNYHKCRACNTGNSTLEKLIQDNIAEPSVLQNRQYIGRHEIDVLFKDKHVGVEVDGLYWHSSKFEEKRPKNYHINKTNLANSAGIKLLHFWDQEINIMPEIVYSVIRAKLGLFEQKIYARKCLIKELEFDITKIFLDNNHMQSGSSVGSIRYGLFYHNELVSVMTFCKSRFNKNYEYELLRFCNKLNTTVIGGASKLFKYALNKGLNSIVSYANLRWSNGELYEKLGFQYITTSEPNYFYTNGTKSISRIAAQKHKLQKLLGDDKFDSNKSEMENMLDNNYFKIYDCGNKSYGFKLK